MDKIIKKALKKYANSKELKPKEASLGLVNPPSLNFDVFDDFIDTSITVSPTYEVVPPSYTSSIISMLGAETGNYIPAKNAVLKPPTKKKLKLGDEDEAKEEVKKRVKRVFKITDFHFPPVKRVNTRLARKELRADLGQDMLDNIGRLKI